MTSQIIFFICCLGFSFFLEWLMFKSMEVLADILKWLIDIIEKKEKDTYQSPYKRFPTREEILKHAIKDDDPPKPDA